MNVRAKVANDSRRRGTYVVRAALAAPPASADAARRGGRDADRNLVAARAEQRVRVEAGMAAEVSLDLSVSQPHLWQGTSDPYLYSLVVEVVEGGTPVEYYHAVHRGDRSRFEVELVRSRNRSRTLETGDLPHSNTLIGQ